MASSLLPTLLVICALHPAEGGIDLLLSNAGTTEVNGVWRHQGGNNRQILQTKCPICTLICTSHEPIGYFNDRHEFKHVESNYEMFFFKSQDSQDSWYTNPFRPRDNELTTFRWNIQEVVVNDGGEMYGDVLYGVKANASDMAVPLTGWTTHAERWRGALPAPKLQVIGITESADDCDNDECFEYYIIQEASKLLLSPKQTCIVTNWTREVPNSEISKYQRAWNSSGIIALPNLLDEKLARKLRSRLLGHVHSQFWWASFWSPARDGSMMFPLQNDGSTRKAYEDWKQYSYDLRDRQEYSYSFTRTSDAIPSRVRAIYPWAFDDLVSFLQSNEMLELLFRITGKSYSLETYFFSRYSSGDFLVSHSDSVEERRIAFVIHLTGQFDPTLSLYLLLSRQLAIRIWWSSPPP